VGIQVGFLPALWCTSTFFFPLCSSLWFLPPVLGLSLHLWMLYVHSLVLLTLNFPHWLLNAPVRASNSSSCHCSYWFTQSSFTLSYAYTNIHTHAWPSSMFSLLCLLLERLTLWLVITVRFSNLAHLSCLMLMSLFHQCIILINISVHDNLLLRSFILLFFWDISFVV
jgi:hypothetical protein